MDRKDITRIRLPSGINVDLSEKVLDECLNNFNDLQFFSFNNFINSGLYFPQIMQFIAVMFCICSGYTSFKDVFLCNLISGIGYTIVWYILKLYKFPGLSFISCLLGGNFFRFFLHFIIIIVTSLFFVKEWAVIIFCMIGGIITTLIKSFLVVKFSTAKYNDEIAVYVSKFKYD